MHPIIKLTQNSARAYAETADMYCEPNEIPELAVNDDHDLFMRCKAGTFTIWHGYNRMLCTRRGHEKV